MNPTTAGCGSILESGLMARLRPAHCGDRLVHSGELEASIAHVVTHPDLSRLSDPKNRPARTLHGSTICSQNREHRDAAALGCCRASVSDKKARRYCRRI